MFGIMAYNIIYKLYNRMSYLASFTSKRSEMETGGRFSAYSTQLTHLKTHTNNSIKTRIVFDRVLQRFLRVKHYENTMKTTLPHTINNNFHLRATSTCGFAKYITHYSPVHFHCTSAGSEHREIENAIRIYSFNLYFIKRLQ